MNKYIGVALHVGVPHLKDGCARLELDITKSRTGNAGFTLIGTRFPKFAQFFQNVSRPNY